MTAVLRLPGIMAQKKRCVGYSASPISSKGKACLMCTWAAQNLSDDTPQEVKQDRLQQLMSLQEDISLDIQEQKVGQTLRVIVDREEDDYYIGRTEWDSPEVDPEVLIGKDKPLDIGSFTQVKITQALPFELIATPV